MNLQRWQPRTAVRRFNDTDTDFDRLFDWAFGNAERGWTRSMFPALDIVEEENRYVVRADLPGMTKEDIEITYQNGLLTLKGEKKRQEEKKDGSRTYVCERFEGKFGRNLQLPEKVDVSRIEANMKDGVLELVLPFSPEAQPRRIDVR